MSEIFDQKTVVGLVCLGAILGLVFAGKADGATAVDFIKWIAAAYIGAGALTTAAGRMALARTATTPGSPEHRAQLKALGAVVPDPDPAKKP